MPLAFKIFLLLFIQQLKGGSEVTSSVTGSGFLSPAPVNILVIETDPAISDLLFFTCAIENPETVKREELNDGTGWIRWTIQTGQLSAENRTNLYNQLDQRQRNGMLRVPNP